MHVYGIMVFTDKDNTPIELKVLKAWKVTPPKQKNRTYDDYEIGGRWSGMFRTKNGASVSKVKTLGNIKDKFPQSPFALCVDGKWKFRGTEPQEENSAWGKKFRKIWEQLPTTASVAVVDMHY